MTLGLSHVVLAGALTASAAGIGGFFYGTSVGAAQEQAAQARANAAADKVRDELQGEIDAHAEQRQSAEYTRQANVREIYHETQKIIDRPVYRNVCIDPDGVGLLDRAATIANGAGLSPSAGAATAATPGSAQ